jgi:hypothetical protein
MNLLLLLLLVVLLCRRGVVGVPSSTCSSWQYLIRISSPNPSCRGAGAESTCHIPSNLTYTLLLLGIRLWWILLMLMVGLW